MSRQQLARQRLRGRPERGVLKTRDSRRGRGCASRDEAPVERQHAFLAVRQRYRERARIAEPGLTVHHADRRNAGEDALVLGSAQLCHEPLLLCRQFRPVNDHTCRRDRGIKRAAASDVGDVRRLNEDLRRYTAHVHAGPADHPPLDQRDRRAEFGRLERRRHGATAAADDCDPRRVGARARDPRARGERRTTGHGAATFSLEG